MHKTAREAAASKRLIAGVVLLGVGLGGFFDGIVLHQILQWHHMLSEVEPTDTVAGLQLNVLADGLFHASTYIATVAGLALVWSAERRSPRSLSWLVLIGGLLAGWGLFNLVEGLVDHHILQVHHVRPGANELAWDLGFLAWGAVMLAAGIVAIRAARRRVRERQVFTPEGEVHIRRAA